MTYYRLALQERQASTWIWKSTALTSLDALVRLLRIYSFVPKERIRVFISSSKEELHEMLNRENTGLGSGSFTALQFLQDRHLHAHESAQGASEPGTAENSVCQSIAVATSLSLPENNTVPCLPAANAMSALDKKRLEIELGTGGDHDAPYRFSLPVSMPQLLTWTRLLARVQAGELQP